ncbi:MAG: ATP-binding protein, partial [Imperialibacter sp.]
MGKIQSISQKLKQINDAVFQELCDSFLAVRNPAYRSFVRSGSHQTKQKTVKGTPDSFFLLSNGNYLFVESTTTEKDLFKKLKNDLENCLNSSITGIEQERIQEIILCYNSDLSIEEVENLNGIVKESKAHGLTLYGLGSLSTEISLHNRNLAKDYLGLPFDTGQIVSLEKFVEAYNRSSQRISTPLDNKFLHRSKELEDFVSLISTNDVLILTGPAGVGKTRLAIEGIKVYLSQNLNYDSYAVADKSADILEDLNQYFGEGSKSLLLVDDANRFDRRSE